MKKSIEIARRIGIAAVAMILCVASAAAEDAKGGPNLLDDSSFEVGVGHAWGVSLGSQPSRASWNSYYDATTAVDGKYSLKIPMTRVQVTPELARSQFGIESRSYAVKSGHQYTLSLYMKADKPCNVVFELAGLGVIGKNDRGRPKLQPDTNALHKVAKVATEWARFSVTAELPEAAAGLYHVKLECRGDDGAEAPGFVWVDAVQLQEGNLTDYASAQPVQVGFHCPVPGNIYYDTEPAKLDLLVFNSIGTSGAAKINYTITDLFDHQVDKGTAWIDLSKHKNIEQTIDLFNKRRGIFRLLASVDGTNSAPAELVYSVLPPNTHLNEMYKAGFLGTDTNLKHDTLQILKRANFNWAMSKFIARWNAAEPEKGHFVFNDEAVDNAHKAGVALVLQICWTNTPALSWALKNDPKKGEAGKGAAPTWDETAKAQFLKDLSEFTYGIVDHYKGKVKYYELTNEPYFAYTPEQIGFVYKAMSAAAKKADPDCIVGVNTDYRIYVDDKGQYLPNRPQYLPELVKAHGLDYTDVITAHFYNNNLALYLPWGEHLKKYNKPGWNSETGPTPPTFYKTLPTVESVEQGAAWWSKTQRPDIIKFTDIMEKNLLFTISAGQMQKYFYYFSRFSNCSPSQPTKRGGGGKENVEFDGGLRCGAVAQSVVSHFFEGCQYASHWTKDPRVDLYLFHDGVGTKGYMYSAGAQPKALALTLPASGGKTEFFDLMSNPEPLNSKGELIVTPLVTFFRSPQSPDALTVALDGVQIHDSPLPVERVWYGDFEGQ
jgi:hypothetical protein